MSKTAMDIGICPYFRGGTAKPTKGAAYAVYCRLPGGRVRIPSRDETLRFCVTGHQCDCPGYRHTRMDDLFAGAQS